MSKKILNIEPKETGIWVVEVVKKVGIAKKKKWG